MDNPLEKRITLEMEPFFKDLGYYEVQKKELARNLEHFRQLLESRPLDSVEYYEKCVLECVRFGWDEEAVDCAKRLANVIKSSSRYKKLALSWRLKPCDDMCMVLLSRELTDFFCDFPINSAMFDLNRLTRFRYSMWGDGKIFVFGDNSSNLLGVKQKMIPKDAPVELKLPSMNQLAAMGSSQYHTVFQTINGEFYGCGLARNFMMVVKNNNETFAEPTKIDLKFESTDPVKNFYVSDHGTLIFTAKYIYLIGRQIDTKKRGKKWTSAFPESWFSKVAKGSEISKNVMRFTIDSQECDVLLKQAVRDDRVMPHNGCYMSVDNHAIVNFKGKPVKVMFNERLAYYRFENEDSCRHIVNFVKIGTEMKMGKGPDSIYPNGLCISMNPGQTLYMGQLQWAKKANCTDENDVKQHTLIAYMDEIHAKFFMERFVATPGPRGFIYQVGRPERLPFYTLKPMTRDVSRLKMWLTYQNTLEKIRAEKEPTEVTYREVRRMLAVIERDLTPEVTESAIGIDSKHIHAIGLLAFVLSERTRLMKCHARCMLDCLTHPFTEEASTVRKTFREVKTMPRLVDADSDTCSAGPFSSFDEKMSFRLKNLIDHYDDHMQRFTPIWLSKESRTIMEAGKFVTDLEIMFYRDRGLPVQAMYLDPELQYKCLKRNLKYIEDGVQWLEENEALFIDYERETNLETVHNLVSATLAWTEESLEEGKKHPWQGYRTANIATHFKTRNARAIMENKVQSEMLVPGTVPMDVVVCFHCVNKPSLISHTHSDEDFEAYLQFSTNRVLLAMINPKLVDHVRDGVLDVNEILGKFDNLWSVSLEYPIAVYFFLQQYREAPITAPYKKLPYNVLDKFGLTLELRKHAAFSDCPERKLGITWHYAALKNKKERSDQEIIAPGGFDSKDVFRLKCLDGEVFCHRYLLQIYTRHPFLHIPFQAEKKDLEVEEDSAVVLAALRILSDMVEIDKHPKSMQLKIVRFYNVHMFPEALEDALAVLVISMKEDDAEFIRTLISDFPMIMERHIGILRPTIVLTWKDDFLPEPKIIHMARIVEHWPGKKCVDERITKSFLDPTFSRLLRTDETWKRNFFTNPDDEEKEDIRQMLKEDMFTKMTFSFSDAAEIDEI